MSKLYSSKDIISTLKQFGFVEVSQKGSHLKLRFEKYTVIIPHPRHEIPMGTFKSILRQAGLSLENFKRKL